MSRITKVLRNYNSTFDNISKKKKKKKKKKRKK